MANLPVAADRALIMGLVHEVWPDETFEEEVMRFCQHLAEQNGEQMGAAKIAIELAHDVSLAQARNVERLANFRPDVESGLPRGHREIYPGDRRQTQDRVTDARRARWKMYGVYSRHVFPAVTQAVSR